MKGAGTLASPPPHSPPRPSDPVIRRAMAEPARAAGSTFRVWLTRLVEVEPHEVRAPLWSFAYFFSLLCGYYIVRPMRDAMGIAGGVEQLHWLFTGTFVAMLAAVPLFGCVTSRFPRRRFLPWSTTSSSRTCSSSMRCSAARAAGSRPAPSSSGRASTTCSWCPCSGASWPTSTRAPQARRLFGFIAAGGTTGRAGRTGAGRALARPLGPRACCSMSAGFMGIAVLCVHRLVAWKAGSGAAASGRAPAPPRRARSAVRRRGHPARATLALPARHRALHAALHHRLHGALLPAGADRPRRRSRAGRSAPRCSPPSTSP